MVVTSGSISTKTGALLFSVAPDRIIDRCSLSESTAKALPDHELLCGQMSLDAGIERILTRPERGLEGIVESGDLAAIGLHERADLGSSLVGGLGSGCHLGTDRLDCCLECLMLLLTRRTICSSGGLGAGTEIGEADLDGCLLVIGKMQAAQDPAIRAVLETSPSTAMITTTTSVCTDRSVASP